MIASKLEIVQSRSEDIPYIKVIIRQAFENIAFSDHREGELFQRIAVSEYFIPKLSLCAYYDSKMVGHILLSKICIDGHDGTSHDSLALAPVSVIPEFQNKGIGGMLIRRSHDIASNLGHAHIALVGHAQYYPRFGYRPASTYGIQFPFEVPDENGMIVEIVPNSLKEISGIIKYPKPWQIE